MSEYVKNGPFLLINARSNRTIPFNEEHAVGCNRSLGLACLLPAPFFALTAYDCLDM